MYSGRIHVYIHTTVNTRTVLLKYRLFIYTYKHIYFFPIQTLVCLKGQVQLARRERNTHLPRPVGKSKRIYSPI